MIKIYLKILDVIPYQLPFQCSFFEKMLNIIHWFNGIVISRGSTRFRDLKDFTGSLIQIKIIIQNTNTNTNINTKIIIIKRVNISQSKFVVKFLVQFDTHMPL